LGESSSKINLEFSRKISEDWRSSAEGTPS
jgi:hypothetical protein